MSGNCFVKQLATSELISNVASFCSECYSKISKDETVYYDMQNCRYLCNLCQEKYQASLDENCEPLTSNSSLFH
jgi:hypothetical protein